MVGVCPPCFRAEKLRKNAEKGATIIMRKLKKVMFCPMFSKLLLKVGNNFQEVSKKNLSPEIGRELFGVVKSIPSSTEWMG